MAATGFLREDFVEGDPVRKVCSATQARRIARILNSIEGVGCIVERCYSQEGFGWRIVVPESAYQAKPDTSGYSTTKDPDGRQTLEKNPEPRGNDTNSHKGEWQLRNVQNVLKGSSSVPFFVSESLLQGDPPNNVVGELYWAQADANRLDDGTAASYKSIDIANTYSDLSKGKWNLGIYGFEASGTCTVPYSTHAIVPGVHTDKALTWRVPVTLGGNAYPGYVGPPGTADLISTVAAASGATTHSAKLSLKKRVFTVAAGAGNLDATETSISDVTLPVDLNYSAIASGIGFTNHTHNHRDLTWTSGAWSYGALCSDHDARLLLKLGTSGDDWANGNLANSIAYNIAGKFGIDFANGRLMRESGAGASVDYKNTYLYAANGTQTADWSYGILYAPPAAGGWATYTNCGFSVGSGGNLSVLGGKTDLLYAAGTDALKLTTGATGSPTLQIHATAESSVPVVYLDNLRLMIGHSTSTWIGFEATAGQLRIVDNTGAELAKFTTGEPA
jgi:hypothetical protein